jgi:hypothetical protein
MSRIQILHVQRACGIPCVQAGGGGAGFAFAVNVRCGPLLLRLMTEPAICVPARLQLGSVLCTAVVSLAPQAYVYSRTCRRHTALTFSPTLTGYRKLTYRYESSACDGHAGGLYGTTSVKTRFPISVKAACKLIIQPPRCVWEWQLISVTDTATR